MHERDLQWRRFYDRFAPFYDASTWLFSHLFGFSDRDERCKMVERLSLTPGARVLEVSAGTGANLPQIAVRIGSGGTAVALDLSRGMLRQCRRTRRGAPARVRYVEAEATCLPFVGRSFDAVLHFGGINEFGDPGAAITEMMRVARPGARIVIGDEGLDPTKAGTLRGRLLLKLNRLYAHRPPLDLIPASAGGLEQTWFRGGACYLIAFTNP